MIKIFYSLIDSKFHPNLSSPTRTLHGGPCGWVTGNHPSTSSLRRKLLRAIRMVPRSVGLVRCFSLNKETPSDANGGNSVKRKDSCHSGEPIPFFTVVRPQSLSLMWISQNTSKSTGSASVLHSIPEAEWTSHFQGSDLA